MLSLPNLMFRRVWGVSLFRRFGWDSELDGFLFENEDGVMRMEDTKLACGQL